VLKPDVVFFGGSVPETTLASAWTLFDEAEALLVVGSSLTVWSGYRFVRRAGERGVPVAIVNLGPTRADGEAVVRVSARAGALLPGLVGALADGRAG
jgi:NAD-dependent SIR2 family protein deacetylase